MLQQDVIQPLNMGLRNLTETVTCKKHIDQCIFLLTPILFHPFFLFLRLKWKPPESNTVDFRIAARWSKEHKPIYSIEVLSHGVTYKFYDHFQPEPALATE